MGIVYTEKALKECIENTKLPIPLLNSEKIQIGEVIELGYNSGKIEYVCILDKDEQTEIHNLLEGIAKWG